MARPLAAYRIAWQRDFTSKGSKGVAAQVPKAKAAAMLPLKEGGFVYHGLRKNAVTMLLEAGNTEAEVSAIVEMSEQMVRHYSRDVNKRRLAINRMKKLEECWEQTRANLFGDGARHGRWPVWTQDRNTWTHPWRGHSGDMN